MKPIMSIEIRNPRVGMRPDEHAFDGIEDLRLFETADGELGVMGTSVNYSYCDKSRVVYGEIEWNETDAYFKDFAVLQPPEEHWGWEKNWIPFNLKNRYVYKWSPYQVGEIVESEGGRGSFNGGKRGSRILSSVNYHSRLCKKFRGSSIFVEGFQKNELIGVVHYCKEGAPRHYFHCLVLMDSQTLKPVKHTVPFYFENLGVEFCIGFSITFYEGGRKDTRAIGAMYNFWISQFDRDPVLIRVGVECLPFLVDVC